MKITAKSVHLSKLFSVFAVPRLQVKPQPANFVSPWSERPILGKLKRELGLYGFLLNQGRLCGPPPLPSLPMITAFAANSYGTDPKEGGGGRRESSHSDSSFFQLSNLCPFINNQICVTQVMQGLAHSKVHTGRCHPFASCQIRAQSSLLLRISAAFATTLLSRVGTTSHPTNQSQLSAY